MQRVQPLIRLVLADDDPVVRTTMERVLARAEDLELVGLAPDGASACSLVQQLDPDVVVLDVHMPEPDGLAVARQLRAEGNQVPILFLTADPDAAELTADIAGADVLLKSASTARQTLDAIRASAGAVRS